MISKIATDINIGLQIGNTILKKVCSGLQPSIAAAYSISIGILLINPVNINIASPAPNPK